MFANLALQIVAFAFSIFQISGFLQCILAVYWSETRFPCLSRSDTFALVMHVRGALVVWEMLRLEIHAVLDVTADLHGSLVTCTNFDPSDGNLSRRTLALEVSTQVCGYTIM